MENETPWPESVPISPKIGTKQLNYPTGEPCCLLGWVDDTFRVLSAHRCKAEKALAKAIKGELSDKNPYTLKSTIGCITSYNDCPATSLADRQRVWNKAMAALGYTEGNPQA